MIKSHETCHGRRPDGIHMSLNVSPIARVFDITGGMGQPSPPPGSARRGGDGEIWPAAWCVGRGFCTARAESLRLSSHPERICRGVTQRGLDDRRRPGQVSRRKKRAKKFNPCGRNHFIYFPLSLISVKSSQAIFFNGQLS